MRTAPRDPEGRPGAQPACGPGGPGRGQQLGVNRAPRTVGGRWPPRGPTTGGEPPGDTYPVLGGKGDRQGDAEERRRDLPWWPALVGLAARQAEPVSDSSPVCTRTRSKLKRANYFNMNALAQRNANPSLRAAELGSPRNFRPAPNYACDYTAGHVRRKAFSVRSDRCT